MTDKAETRLQQAMKFHIEKVGDEWHYKSATAKRTILASIAEIKLWNHALSLTERVQELEGALERMTRNFKRVLVQIPVRDADETIAEAERVLKQEESRG